MSLSELAALADDEFMAEVADRLMDKRLTVGLVGLTRAEQNMSLAEDLRHQVNNGGFHQFFFNPTGDCAVRTMAALEEIGLSTTTSVYRRALAVFPHSQPEEDRASRNDQIEALPNEFDAWNHLDREFWNASCSQLTVYVRSHRSEFDLPPEPP
jgi:hypothetical protein